MKRLTFLAALLLTAACQSLEELSSPSAPVLFGIEEAETGTRSLLTASGIETKKTGITLAAYRNGALEEAAHFTTSLGAMPLPLEKGGAYMVYALVNMGDQTAALPALESDWADFTYTLSLYSTINRLGIPMAGKLSCTAGSGSTAIPVQRLLAKVAVDLTVDIPGASIGEVRVYNLNRRLKPFGVSAISASGDVLGAQEVATGSGPGENKSASGSGASGHFVLYVPENRQGNISGISTSRQKNPDLNATVDARLDRLSYLEVQVSLSGYYGGGVTYRSCLGNNATSNFDIVRNKLYHWQIHYLENGLQIDDWKCDTGSLTDSRRVSWRGGEEEDLAGTPARVFSVYQGESVQAGVDYGYTYQGNFIPLTGLAGSDWTWTASPASGVTSTAGLSGGKDVVTYAAGSSAPAGYYPIRVERTARTQGDDAFLHVLPYTEVSYRYFISDGYNASATPTETYTVSSDRNYQYYFYLIEHQVTKERGVVVEDVFTRAVPASETVWSFDPSVSHNIGTYGASGYVYDALLVLCSGNDWMRFRPAYFDTNVAVRGQHGWSRILASPTAHPEVQCALDVRVDGYGYRYALQPETASIYVGGTVQLSMLQWKDRYQGDVRTSMDTGAGTNVSSYFVWDSRNPDRVSVTNTGLCTGRSSGAAIVNCKNYNQVNGDYETALDCNATITVGDGGEHTYVLELNPASGRLKAGHTAVLTATLIHSIDGVEISRTTNPSGITWSSGNTAIATVNASGTVTGISPGGPVSITASWTDGSHYAQKSASVEVLPPSGFGIDTGWEDDGSEINL